MLVYCNNFTIFSTKNKYNVSNGSFAFWQERLDFVFGKGKFCRKQKEKRNFCCELLFKGVWS